MSVKQNQTESNKALNSWIQHRREEFPLLQNNPELAYLDNAATTQKPQSVIDTLNSYYSEYNSNVHRALYGIADRATKEYESARAKTAAFIGASSAENIVFTRGTTESINLAANSFAKSRLKPGDEIVLTEMEHHSNLIPWQIAAERYGAKLKFIPFNRNADLDLQELESLLTEKVKLVSLVHQSNVFGTVNPVKKITSMAHSKGIPVLIDAAQSIPHMKIDVQDLDCDMLVFSGHKMYGPMGIGVFYAKKGLLEELPPFMSGGEMISAVWLEKATWNDIPYKFEAGTPNVAGAIGLGTAVDYINSIGFDAIEKAEQSLTVYAENKLKQIPGLTIYGEPEQRGAVLSFNIEGLHSHDIAQFLDKEDIAVRSGHHCAHPVMRKLKIPSTARASFSFYNTHDEIDRLCAGLKKTQEFFKDVL